MVEQPKLLRRPLPPKLLSKPSTPRENVCEEMALEEKMIRSVSLKQLLQEQKKEKAYTIHYLKLPESEKGFITDFNDAPDGNTMEDVWETNFYFIASKQDEEVKLMPGSQVEVLCYFLYQKFALSLQVFNIKTLQVLVLWNNSISEIPNDIHRLKSLKKFTISFNLLSHLPSGLFSAEDLQYLDIACNDTTFIPNGIKNLRCLFRFGRLPFYFLACSSSCRRNFMSQTEAWLQYFVESDLDYSKGTANGIKQKISRGVILSDNLGLSWIDGITCCVLLLYLS